MTERLSDERLRELCDPVPKAMPAAEVPAMASELLERRAEVIALNGALRMAAAERDNFAAALAAGPVMPEGQSR